MQSTDSDILGIETNTNDDDDDLRVEVDSVDAEENERQA